MPYADFVTDQVLVDVRDRMREYVAPYVTAMCTSKDLVSGTSHATGNFVRIDGTDLLLTNEHVPRLAERSHLSYLVRGKNAVGVGLLVAEAAPLDAAVCRLYTDHLNGTPCGVLDQHLFDAAFAPCPGEIMFFLGYPIVGGQFDDATNYMSSTAYCLASDIVDLPPLPDLDPAKQFAVRYPLFAYSHVGEAAGLVEPVGFSGSLVWDTKRVAAGPGEWSPSQARVAGLAFGFSENKVLVVKIEHVLKFIGDVLAHPDALDG